MSQSFTDITLALRQDKNAVMGYICEQLLPINPMDEEAVIQLMDAIRNNIIDEIVRLGVMHCHCAEFSIRAAVMAYFHETPVNEALAELYGS